MQSFQSVSQDELLDSLTEYYQHYRKLDQFGGGEEEITYCLSMLTGILDELNYRQKFYRKSERQARHFSFERKGTEQ